jgi:hypothetical protein
VQNPECKPVVCDDGDPATSGDQCGKTADGTCGCTGIAIADPCAEVLNPLCKAVGCLTVFGAKGRCDQDLKLGCGCQPILPDCATDFDCLGRAWTVKCNGSWDCVGGTCQPICGEPCGDGTCSPKAGENSATCPADCPLDPCGDVLNPKCAASSCLTVAGAKGTCQASLLKCQCVAPGF